MGNGRSGRESDESDENQTRNGRIGRESDENQTRIGRELDETRKWKNARSFFRNTPELVEESSLKGTGEGSREHLRNAWRDIQTLDYLRHETDESDENRTRFGREADESDENQTRIGREESIKNAWLFSISHCRESDENRTRIGRESDENRTRIRRGTSTACIPCARKSTNRTRIGRETDENRTRSGLGSSLNPLDTNR